MNLVNFYELQRVLDERVAERVKGAYDTTSHYSIDDRIYAFHTEVHELANEIGFFKFWKLGHSQDPQRILDELVDCIHFLLSIGLAKGYNSVVKHVEPFILWEDYSMYDLFTLLRENNVGNVGHYQRSFSLILGIGEKLGYTEDQIEEAYLSKNKTNHDRQSEGY